MRGGEQFDEGPRVLHAHAEGDRIPDKDHRIPRFGSLPCRIPASAETLSIDPDLHSEGAPREPRRIAVSVFAGGREEATVDAEEVHRRHSDPDDRFAEQQHKRCRERHQQDRGGTRMPLEHARGGVAIASYIRDEPHRRALSCDTACGSDRRA